MVPLFILLFILPATLPAAELIVWGVPKDRGLMAALRLFETGAMDSLVSRDHLEAIGLRPKAQRTYELADGREKRRPAIRL